MLSRTSSTPIWQLVCPSLRFYFPVLTHAAEVALRSTGGSLAIKDPKFFLAFQIARIKTAQGVTITNTGQKVQHLLGKVINNAGSEDQATKDKVTALSTVLS
jgi:hypothetical protein